MATGMAIMGFGGGAHDRRALADLLMKHFATPTSVGVKETFLAMGAIYFVAMLAGAFGYRVPPPGWTASGTGPQGDQKSSPSGDDHRRHVHVSQAWKTPQFWLLWACCAST